MSVANKMGLYYTTNAPKKVYEMKAQQSFNTGRNNKWRYIPIQENKTHISYRFLPNQIFTI